jgi:hypothetical protein
MSIVSNDQDNFTFVPAAGAGPRRVSVRVALPVILGCAVIGSVLGVTLPLRSLFPGEHVPEQPAELSLASLRLVENPPTAGQKIPSLDPARQAEQPEMLGTQSVLSPTPISAAPTVALSTGSMVRPLSPGVSDRAALTSPEGQQVSPPESAERLTGPNHRVARAKRLRRVMSQRARVWKPQTSELEYLFGPLLPKK